MPDGTPPVPPIRYSPAQQRIITHRGGDLQVVAGAGSGKTETVARRIAGLVAEGVAPAAIVAFTFTEAAAASLKDRVFRKVAEVQPERDADELSPMFVGTIHAWCLRLLQAHAPHLAFAELFEEHRLVGLCLREYDSLGLQRLGTRRTEVVRRFLRSVDVVENEMIPAERLPEDEFRGCFARLLATLARYHVLTFNQCVAKAVETLEREHVRDEVFTTLRHLVVDEFQDLNPAQARLLSLLGCPPVALCVVGDDDQAIYQWRGSSVEYLRAFQGQRGARVETLGENRRSHASIVTRASSFAARTPGRLPKAIAAVRGDHALAIHASIATTDVAEAERVGDAVLAMRARGFAYRDIAVLLRSVKTSGAPFFDALARRGIPVRSEGRQALFLQPDAAILGDVFVWLAGDDQAWSRESGVRPLGIEVLVRELGARFALSRASMGHVRVTLLQWRESLPGERDANLLGVFYALLGELGVRRWDPSLGDAVTRLGVLARFSALLADFEGVYRRAYRVNGPERYHGGMSGGVWYLCALSNYLAFYAREHYEDFSGEPDHDLDAVTVTTVHASKGLEWPVVFVPCLVNQRFPVRTRPGDWFVDRDVFPAARYEGSDDDERRLFYVAMTRARDHLYLSAFARKKNRVATSPFFLEVAPGFAVSDAPLPVPDAPFERPRGTRETPTFSFSEVALYRTCPQQYRLRQQLGFQPAAVKEIGYGKAVHHLLRRVAEHARETGVSPTTPEIEAIVSREFYLPFADRPALATMERRARTLIDAYLRDFRADLDRVWETERPFELHLDEATIAGRADVLLDREGGVEGAMAIVDYKTRDVSGDASLATQLRVYTAAARGEGIDARAAYLHDLGGNRRTARVPVDVSPRAVDAARREVGALAGRIRLRCFDATPGAHCASCDVRSVCGAAR